MCTTSRSNHEIHVSTECSVGGSGQCDGFCIQHNDECTCLCHTAYVGLPDTTEGVRNWHDEQDSVFASFPFYEHLNTGPGHEEAWSEAMTWLGARTPDTKEFRVVGGQGRVVVQEYYR